MKKLIVTLLLSFMSVFVFGQTNKTISQETHLFPGSYSGAEYFRIAKSGANYKVSFADLLQWFDLNSTKLDSIAERNDSVFYYHGGTEYFSFVISGVANPVGGIGAYPYIAYWKTPSTLSYYPLLELDTLNQIFSFAGTSSGFAVDNLTSYTYINTTSIQIQSVDYVWPGSQGGVNTFLKNDGSGNLTWSSLNIDSTSFTSGEFWKQVRAKFSATSPVSYNSTTGVFSLSSSTISGVSLGSNLFSHTNGWGITGSAYNGSAAQTWRLDTSSLGVRTARYTDSAFVTKTNFWKSDGQGIYTDSPAVAIGGATPGDYPGYDFIVDDGSGTWPNFGVDVSANAIVNYIDMWTGFSSTFSSVGWLSVGNGGGLFGVGDIGGTRDSTLLRVDPDSAKISATADTVEVNSDNVEVSSLTWTKTDPDELDVRPVFANQRGKLTIDGFPRLICHLDTLDVGADITTTNLPFTNVDGCYLIDVFLNTRDAGTFTVTAQVHYNSPADNYHDIIVNTSLTSDDDNIMNNTGYSNRWYVRHNSDGGTNYITWDVANISGYGGGSYDLTIIVTRIK